MPLKQSIRFAYHGFRRALRLVARPVRRVGGPRGLVIQPYRGYGTRDEIYLMGRVFRQPKWGGRIQHETVLRDTVDLARRLARFGLGGAQITARFAGTEKPLETDRDGYFHVHMPLNQAPPSDRLWHEVDLELHHKGETVRDVGEVFVPPDSARFVVISDIDDTVMYTGVANKAKMLYRLFMQEAESRVAFPGVGALYRALHYGVSGDEKNPMLYVSRAPWSIYEVLDEFFQMHRIPVGPILFLREWGMTLQRPLPRRAKAHKRDLIEDMLARYSELPFILIGDSGQHDPEVYAEAVRQHPDRVLAVYIRNVSKGAGRPAEIEKLAREIEKAGSTLMLASDTFTMAKHASERGFISEADLADVIAERIEDAEEIEGTAGTRKAPAEQVNAVLESGSRKDAPPNVVVEE
jgi:phosphatidate phosphatase APP1